MALFSGRVDRYPLVSPGTASIAALDAWLLFIARHCCVCTGAPVLLSDCADCRNEIAWWSLLLSTLSGLLPCIMSFRVVCDSSWGLGKPSSRKSWLRAPP